MVWHFIGVYIINRTLHDRLEIRNFSSRVEKYFSTLEEKFRISAQPCNILYYLCFLLHFISYSVTHLPLHTVIQNEHKQKACKRKQKKHAFTRLN